MFSQLDVGRTKIVLQTSFAELFPAGYTGHTLVVDLTTPPAHDGAGTPVCSTVGVVTSLTQRG